MSLTPSAFSHSGSFRSLIEVLGLLALSACNTGDVGIVSVIVKAAGTGAGNVIAVGNVQSGTDDIDINCDFPGHSCEDAIEVPGDESAGGYLNLIATASEGSHFTSWTGCSSSAGSVCTLRFPPRQTWTITAQFDLGPTPARYRLAIESGNGQAASGGTVLPGLLVVQFVDEVGFPGPATTLDWQVAGNGSIAQTRTTTDEEGFSENTWTLGPAGTPQSVAVSEPGGSSVTFTATATPGGLIPRPESRPATAPRAPR